MKQGQSLQSLAVTLETIKNESRDFVVPVEKMKAVAVGAAEIVAPSDSLLDQVIEETRKKPMLSFGNGGDERRYALNGWSHQQLASYVDVPKGYYDRLLNENADLLVRNINHGLDMVRQSKGLSEVRMVRTIGSTARAFVSGKYRRLDCYDLLETLLPVFMEKGLEVASCELTERRMYIKALSPKLIVNITPGLHDIGKRDDLIQWGIVISSSDVGCGSVRVEPMALRLICSNGAIMDTAIRKFHLGRSQAEDDVYELLTDQTKELTDAAFWSQVKDVTIASLKSENFEKYTDRFRAAAGMPIKNYDIPEVVELTTKHLGISGEKTKETMVAYLANGADGAGLTQWGLLNSITYAAQQDHMNYDDSVNLERVATKVLELPKRTWEQIAHVN